MDIVSLDDYRKTVSQTISTSYTSGSAAPKLLSQNDTISFDKQEDADSHEYEITQIKSQILNVISGDDFADGVLSESEQYMKAIYRDALKEKVKQALMQLYLKNLDDEKILTGVLMMISSVPYETIEPEGPIMAMGLLLNKSDNVRDRSIQAFERWNSKKGIPVLESLKCDKKWMQRYVDDVLLYLKRDGMD